MFELKQFQVKAVSDLMKQTRTLLTSPGNDKICVLKSPTGSGKTIIMADFLQQLAEESLPSEYVFVWTSLYDLHEQSMKKIRDYLSDTRYNLITLDGLPDSSVPANTVLFVNWHSLTTTKMNAESNTREWGNVHVKEREDGKSIVDVLDKTRDEGKEIILVVDEAHRNYLTENSQKFVSQVIKPKLTIEVSATPLIKPDAEAIYEKRAGYIAVNFDDVVSSGLIKHETLINQSIGSFVDLAKSADEAVLNAALEQREILRKHYEDNGISVNPLLLVQLPSETEKTSALDLSVREEVELILAKRGITYQNRKLAVWLSEDKQNLNGIEAKSAEAEVLIFKEAVAVGWDCPRAQVLVMLRAIKSISFEIQTVGRILRTPEAKHYDCEALNKAYVYTNVHDIKINTKPEELDFFKTKFAKRKDAIEDLSLASTYLHRQDYGDLTASFTGLLIDSLNERFGISQNDMVNQAYEKADKFLELYMDELKSPLMADVVVGNLDKLSEEIGVLNIKTVDADVSEANIQRQFDYLMKAWSLPYAPVRSFTKIKQAIYKWFETLGYGKSMWGDVQRIVACSTVNQVLFDEAIKSAKLKYEKVRTFELSSRKASTFSFFNIPDFEMFGEGHEAVSLGKYALEPALLQVKRSEPERKLEAILESSENVLWWYKNGEGRQIYFSIAYETRDAETGMLKQANFYPDFIAKLKDGSVAILETKSGNTAVEQATHDKSNAMQRYIKEQNEQGKKIFGGIVNSRNEGMFIFTGESYEPDISAWNRLDI